MTETFSGLNFVYFHLEQELAERSGMQFTIYKLIFSQSPRLRSNLFIIYCNSAVRTVKYLLLSR